MAKKQNSTAEKLALARRDPRQMSIFGKEHEEELVKASSHASNNVFMKVGQIENEE